MLDDLFAGQVALVADEELVDALDGVAVNFLQPLLDVGECVCGEQRLPSASGQIAQRAATGLPTIVGHVVDDNDAMCAAVVRRGDGPEPLLASRVPLRSPPIPRISTPSHRITRNGHPGTHNLQLDRLALELDRADLEVDADRRDVALGVGVVCESQEETRLADARVADEQELQRTRSGGR